MILLQHVAGTEGPGLAVCALLIAFEYDEQPLIPSGGHGLYVVSDSLDLRQEPAKRGAVGRELEHTQIIQPHPAVVDLDDTVLIHVVGLGVLQYLHGTPVFPGPRLCPQHDRTVRPVREVVPVLRGGLTGRCVRADCLRGDARWPERGRVWLRSGSGYDGPDGQSADGRHGNDSRRACGHRSHPGGQSDLQGRRRHGKLGGRRLAGSRHLAKDDQRAQQRPLVKTVVQKFFLERLFRPNEQHTRAKFATTHRFGNFGVRHTIVTPHHQNGLITGAELLHGVRYDFSEFLPDQAFESFLALYPWSPASLLRGGRVSHGSFRPVVAVQLVISYAVQPGPETVGFL